MDSLEEYIKLNHPIITKEYERYCTQKWEDLKVEQPLLILRAGYGGFGDNIRWIREINEDDNHNAANGRCITLWDKTNPHVQYSLYEKITYHGETEYWQQIAYVFKKDEYAAWLNMYGQIRRKWFVDNLGRLPK